MAAFKIVWMDVMYVTSIMLISWFLFDAIKSVLEFMWWKLGKHISKKRKIKRLKKRSDM